MEWELKSWEVADESKRLNRFIHNHNNLSQMSQAELDAISELAEAFGKLAEELELQEKKDGTYREWVPGVGRV